MSFLFGYSGRPTHLKTKGKGCLPCNIRQSQSKCLLYFKISYRSDLVCHVLLSKTTLFDLDSPYYHVLTTVLIMLERIWQVWALYYCTTSEVNESPATKISNSFSREGGERERRGKGRERRCGVGTKWLLSCQHYLTAFCRQLFCIISDHRALRIGYL